MTEVLIENGHYRVELDRDTSGPHLPHRSLGTYRVVDRKNSRELFASPNRDKALGVFEFVSTQAGLG